MNHITGKPQALKQVNLSAVRGAIKEKGSATRAEIVDATKISVTTVRKLLTEMLDNNEIVESGFDESIGGRRAVRYEFKKNRFFGAALCMDEDKVHYFIANICGEIQESGIRPITDDISESLCSLLEELTSRIEIKSVGIGVPGVVNGLSYQKQTGLNGLERYSIGEVIHHRFQIPVILENDLNATTLGFGRNILKDSCKNLNLAYIHFGDECLSAGFLSGGRLLRGSRNFVGELGLYPADDFRTLDMFLASPLSSEQYALIVTKLFAGICCILNPQSIAIAGEGFRRECLPMIRDNLEKSLPAEMVAELILAEDMWRDYSEGMAYLTAEQIFADVKLIEG